MNLLRLKKGLICLAVVMGLLAVFSNVLVCAEKSEADFICGTEPEAMQASFNALLQKKLTPQIMPNNENASVQLQSHLVYGDTEDLMPSTGDVKALVLPIEFKDEKLSGTITEKLQDAYFSEKNLSEDYSYEDLSLSDYFKKMSYNKLRITGTVLPVYTIEEDRTAVEAADNIRELIAKAIVEYKDIIGDLTEYDSDGDGGIDCLHVVWAGSAGEWAGPWWPAMRFAKQELYDGIEIRRFVGMTEGDPKHETAHMLGLPDNYVHMYSSGNIGKECLIDSGVRELMHGGCYINMYYKYLLDWISEEDGSLVIITYDDLYNQDKTNNLREIELSAAEQYGDAAAEKPKAVFFVPESKVRLPYEEFYFAEYRSGITAPNSGYNDNPGILMWHCDTRVRQYLNEDKEYLSYTENCNLKGYLKPIYKSIESGTGDEAFVPAKDLYFEGEEFSSKTAPSSEAYKARETGAYLKVNALTQETANITAGYIDPYLGPAPEIKIAEQESKYVSYYVTWDILCSNYDDVLLIGDDKSFITTGTVKVESVLTAESKNKEAYKSYLTRLSGEGTIQMAIRPGVAAKYGIYSGEARSEVLYVDNTPPEITLLGDSEITMMFGDEYIEQGATVTDNEDPDIQSKLRIEGGLPANYFPWTYNRSREKVEMGFPEPGKMGFPEPGTYEIRYEVTDRSGNSASVKRKITVLPIEGDKPRIISCKTQNQDQWKFIVHNPEQGNFMCMVVARYTEDGVLVDSDNRGVISPYAIAEGTYLPEKGSTVKAFLFDSFGNMMPLSEACEVIKE